MTKAKTKTKAKRTKHPRKVMQPVEMEVLQYTVPELAAACCQDVESMQRLIIEGRVDPHSLESIAQFAKELMVGRIQDACAIRENRNIENLKALYERELALVRNALCAKEMNLAVTFDPPVKSATYQADIGVTFGDQNGTSTVHLGSPTHTAWVHSGPSRVSCGSVLGFGYSASTAQSKEPDFVLARSAFPDGDLIIPAGQTISFRTVFPATTREHVFPAPPTQVFTSSGTIIFSSGSPPPTPPQMCCTHWRLLQDQCPTQCAARRASSNGHVSFKDANGISFGVHAYTITRSSS